MERRISILLTVVLAVLGVCGSAWATEVIAYGSKNFTFFRLNLENGTLTTIPCPVSHLQLAFAPDGTLYATSRNTDNLYRFTEPSTGELEYIAKLPVNCVGGDTTASPDGKGVYFTLGWQNRELFRYDIEDAVIDSLGTIIGADDHIYGLAFSADGILYGTTGTGSGEKRLYTIDLVTLQATAVGPALFGIQMHHDSSAGSLDFAPDGTLYAGIQPIDVSLPGTELYLSTINPQTGIGTIDYNKRVLGGLDSIAIAPKPAVKVSVDIRPKSCFNPLNLRSNGILPVAVLGTEDFDVNDIDIASVRLADVAPFRSNCLDITGPESEEPNACGCAATCPDGYTDLTLKFRIPELAEALEGIYGEILRGDELELTFTGQLYDGTLIEGMDYITVVGKPPNRHNRPNLNKMKR